MLELNNATPFVADFAIFPDAKGVDTLYTILKATFNLNNTLTLSELQKPLVKADTYFGEPVNSSLKAASDYHIGKINTDIIVLGNALTVDEVEQPELDVRVNIGDHQKHLKVFGDRDWVSDAMTSPIPFNKMPMIYERAFGGDGALWSQDDYGEVNLNPAGVGFDPSYSDERGLSSKSLPMPNIELANQLIVDIKDSPPPAGIGYVAPHWQPRRYYAGTYDESWKQFRAPYLPKDFKADYFNCASEGLISNGFLKGGEPICIEGMNRFGLWSCNLPIVQLQCAVTISGNRAKSSFNLETVILEPNKETLCMVWRAATSIDKKVLKVERIDIALDKSNVQV